MNDDKEIQESGVEDFQLEHLLRYAESLGRIQRWSRTSDRVRVTIDSNSLSLLPGVARIVVEDLIRRQTEPPVIYAPIDGERRG